MTDKCLWTLDSNRLADLIWFVPCKSGMFRATVNPRAFNYCPWCGKEIDTTDARLQEPK